MQRDKSKNQFYENLRLQRHVEQESLKSQVMGELNRCLAEMRNYEGAPTTQAEVAESLGVSRSTFTRSFNRERNLTLNSVADLAAATGSHCYFYLSRKNRPYWENGQQNLHDFENIKMISWDGFDYSKKSTFKTEDDLLGLARSYVEELLCNEVNTLESNDADLPSCYLGDNDDGLKIELPLGRTDLFTAEIRREYTFEDGFSNIEWILIDHKDTEHFRSPDLGQVVNVLLAVFQRGGFHI